MAKRKRKSGVAKFVKAVTARRVSRSEARENPGRASEGPLENLGDFGHIIAGAGSYVGAKLSGRLVRHALTTRFPKLATFSEPVAGALVLLAAWLTVRHIASLKKHRVPILVGAGIALTQQLVVTFVPQLAWLVGQPAPMALPAGPQAGDRVTIIRPDGSKDATVAEDGTWLEDGDVVDDDLEDLSPSWQH